VAAVRAPSHETPVPRDSEDFSAESGRGLFLVDSFSDSWGWHPLAGTLSGQVVWALFRLQPHAQTTRRLRTPGFYARYRVLCAERAELPRMWPPSTRDQVVELAVLHAEEHR